MKFNGSGIRFFISAEPTEWAFLKLQIMTQEQVKIFESPQFGQIRTYGTSEQPLFCASDICNALGYSNGRKAVLDHCDEGDVTKCDTLTQGGTQSLVYVNESGLYALIFGSKLESAKDFKRWVTSEVLPSIRKSGGYIATTEQDDDKTILAKALNIMQYTLAEREKRLQIADDTIKAQTMMLGEQEETISKQAKTIEEQKPLVTFANSVLGSKDTCLVRDLAKLFTQNGIKIGQKTMLYMLKRDGYICRGEHSDSMPTQKAVEMGVMEYKETTIFDKEGKSHIKRTPKITQKGCQFFFDKYSKIYNERNQVKQ